MTDWYGALASPIPKLYAADVCGSCRKPGACCNGFVLSKTFETDLEALAFLVTYEYECADGTRTTGAPFYPIGFREDAEHGSMRIYGCAYLAADGKCGNYAKRPKHPCESYFPKQDGLCIEHEDPKQEQ